MRSRSYWGYSAILVLAALLGACALLLWLGVHPQLKAPLQGLAGLSLALAGMLIALFACLDLAGYKQPSSLRKAWVIYIAAAAYLTAATLRIFQRFLHYQALLEQAVAAASAAN